MIEFDPKVAEGEAESLGTNAGWPLVDGTVGGGKAERLDGLRTAAV
jgi:hypothetical protein